MAGTWVNDIPLNYHNVQRLKSRGIGKHLFDLGIRRKRLAHRHAWAVSPSILDRALDRMAGKVYIIDEEVKDT
jgi:hypothetical protein